MPVPEPPPTPAGALTSGRLDRFNRALVRAQQLRRRQRAVRSGAAAGAALVLAVAATSLLPLGPDGPDVSTFGDAPAHASGLDFDPSSPGVQDEEGRTVAPTPSSAASAGTSPGIPELDGAGSTGHPSATASSGGSWFTGRTGLGGSGRTGTHTSAGTVTPSTATSGPGQPTTAATAPPSGSHGPPPPSTPAPCVADANNPSCGPWWWTGPLGGDGEPAQLTALSVDVPAAAAGQPVTFFVAARDDAAHTSNVICIELEIDGPGLSGTALVAQDGSPIAGDPSTARTIRSCSGPVGSGGCRGHYGPQSPLGLRNLSWTLSFTRSFADQGSGPYSVPFAARVVEYDVEGYAECPSAGPQPTPAHGASSFLLGSIDIV